MTECSGGLLGEISLLLGERKKWSFFLFVSIWDEELSPSCYQPEDEVNTETRQLQKNHRQVKQALGAFP